MTKIDHPFRDYVQDLFSAIGPIRIRPMFDGSAVYCGEDIFALIDQDQIYLKADEALKADLTSQGGEPFIWTNPETGRTLTMSYVSMPEAACQDEAMASQWGQRALNISIQTRRERVKSPRRRTF